MDVPLLVVLTSAKVYLILIRLLLQFTPTLSQQDEVQPTVKADSPITDVLEGGMLPIHCVFQNLDHQNHVVFIMRNINGKPERLTWNEGLVPGVQDERVFIASRHLGGGGEFAYFFTVIEVTGEDSGEYICQIVTKSTLTMIAENSVNISVLNFPKADPTCNPPSPLPVYIGDMITLNCTVGRTHSELSVEWIRTSTKEKMDSKRKIDQSGQMIAEVSFQSTPEDVGAVFICEVTSPYFPKEKLDCHIGPLTLTVDPSKPKEDTNSIENSVIFTPNKNLNVETPKTMESCKSTCSVYKSPAMYWIIGTIISCILAFVFFIVAVVLCFKLATIPSPPEYGETLYSLQPSEDIYAQLEGRVEGSRLYMTLERPKKPNASTVKDNDANAYMANANQRHDGQYLVPFLHGPQL